jgi:peptidoglycan hydrolase-like protein with peptidoglycan-binding domain
VTQGDAPLLRNIQSGLVKLGYDAGSPDGRMGPRTRAAIVRYQQDNQLPVTGAPSPELWSHISGRI